MSENRSFVDQLMGIKGGAIGIKYDAERDRFNMPHSAETSVRKELNANRIIINGSAIAIASQYPFPHQVEAQLQMMVDNNTPVLIILASSTDIQNHQLPEYFSGTGVFGAIETQSTFVDYIDLGNDIEAKEFRLSIKGYREPMSLPVFHVYTWPDHRTVSPATTTNLIELIESRIAEKTAQPTEGNDGMLPVIHCKAGVGRTGQTIAALAMKKHPELDLDTITTDLRASRNDRMIQTPYQMETLVKMAGEQIQEQQQPKKTSRSWFSFFSR
ncbi:MAG: protein-tyrosine phosphatase family protein [Leucothrix sp.]